MTLNPSASWTLTARWIMPVDGPPLERGIITIRGEHIEAVEPHGTRSADKDLGNVAILPGFVNAHTHLDLSGMRGKCPPGPDFVGWLLGVVGFRRDQTIEQIAAAIETGFNECRSSGTTLLGDIDGTGLTSLFLAHTPMRLVVFYELLGLTKERAEESFKVAAERLAKHRDSPTCRPGISPHAPYSVGQWLFARAAKASAESKLLLATHLAETKEELELLASHSGPFVSFLKALGVWDPEQLVTFPDEVALIYQQMSASSLFVHANFADATYLALTGSTIIYCPRTHAAFGHPPHPFREFLKRGVRVALGTDSLASNPDLDILTEARFVHERHPDVAGETLLRMITLAGAEALGWADETGSLTPGKSADLVVLPLPDDERDPHALVLESAAKVQAVLFRGQWTVGNP